MYLSPTNKHWAIDIEGDGLPSSVIWCMCVQNVVTREKQSLVGHDAIRQWINQKLKDGCKFIGHNIIGYDAPTLNRLLGVRIGMNSIIDTMVMSMLYNPSLAGGHSLESWGFRLKFPKLGHTDFSRFSPEMLTYCEQDTSLCLAAYEALVSRMVKLKYTDVGIEVEHKSWQLIQKQQETGFAFNITGAHILYAKLREEENHLRDEIHAYWPPTLEHVETYKRPYKKDGSPSVNFTRHSEQYTRVEVRGDEYLCFEYVTFNIGSPDQRVEKLLSLGWVPQEFTKTGKPKPTDKGKLTPSLIRFVETSDRPEPALIAKWIEINSRANMVNTWMEAYNEDTKCIHGNIWLANTLRYRHSNPNTANIPAVRIRKLDDDTEVPLLGAEGVYTYEARDLWTVRDLDRRTLVGVDAKGIQLRVLAHYLKNKQFTEAVLDGDPHSYNQQVGGFGTRAVAKTFIYAFLLGAGDGKVGQIIGGTTKDGREIKERFIGNFPGLEQLLKKLESQIRTTGRIRLCDGTALPVTAMHTRLGYLLQGDESRLMKKAAIITAAEVRRRNLDVLKVGDIHDEWQNDVLNEHVPEFKDDVCPAAFRASGEFFNYSLPIGCDSKVGLTWAQTH